MVRVVSIKVKIILSHILPITAFLIVGCTDMKYTVHIDPSFEASKIPPSTIAVFPVDELNYAPPTYCFGLITQSKDPAKYEAVWNLKLRESLMKKFPQQKWVFLKKDNGVLQAGSGIDFFAVKDISKKNAPAVQINALEKDRFFYESMNINPQMQMNLQRLRDATGAHYAVVCISPLLSGEVVTTYNAGGGAFGSGSSSSQTYYTADIQVLVWECSSGKLLFSSGGWCKSSSGCFFISAQDMAIDGADSKFEKNLQKMISRLLDYDKAQRTAQAAR
jgi:hypothetical protein